MTSCGAQLIPSPLQLLLLLLLHCQLQLKLAKMLCCHLARSTLRMLDLAVMARVRASVWRISLFMAGKCLHSQPVAVPDEHCLIYFKENILLINILQRKPIK